MNNAYIRAQQCKVKEAKFPFVKIGTQYWTTKNLSLAVTPQGNTITEVQANGNVEKVVNGGFDTDTSWGKSGAATISGGTCNIVSISGESASIQQTVLTSNKWHKLVYTVLSFSGLSLKTDSIAGSPPINSTIGTHTLYFISSNNVFHIGRTGAVNATIDNISVQEIGWSGSQELYDGIYAQTTGTVEQKTYAAVKAAAMWCHYNNDAPTGLIYGKLYNWFAVKLFQMDIDYYNAANPTKPYIWRMPTQTEFQTLSIYLGGSAVSGGKLKETGLIHWNTPNTGADNSSGFSALGSGRRNEVGVFDNTHMFGYFWNLSNLDSNNSFVNYLSSGDSALNTATTTNIKGFSIRLIKA